MRKNKLLKVLGGAGVATVSYLLMDKSRRDRLIQKAKHFTNSLKQNNNMPIREAGHPEESGIENADMVSEGSQFGVNYYNKVRE
ncbi:hypothetical protein ACFOZ1_05570 [Gracilibacillus marinus]|uniref:YtxH domain-containing protein n=1 Tax=Gracilibacillus marinus TaxID=630535 RepID=A0ABV8VS57_9BACI